MGGPGQEQNGRMVPRQSALTMRLSIEKDLQGHGNSHDIYAG